MYALQMNAAMPTTAGSTAGTPFRLPIIMTVTLWAFQALRVINEDFIAEGQGFGTHPHKDMEILTYVLGGAVEHQDSMGNKEQVPAGEFQIMSAGTGIRHSEYNQVMIIRCICIRSGLSLKKPV